MKLRTWLNTTHPRAKVFIYDANIDRLFRGTAGICSLSEKDLLDREILTINYSNDIYNIKLRVRKRRGFIDAYAEYI